MAALSSLLSSSGYGGSRRRRRRQGLGPYGIGGYGQGGQPFTPFVAPTRPPAGTYDPSLDASLRASDRGLADFQSDYTRDLGRREDDYLLGRGNIETTRDRSLSDLLRGYGTLATHQTEAANAAGLLGGGFAAQSAAKRQANYDREHGRAVDDFSKQLSSLDLGYQRSGEDASQSLARAIREHTEFGTDTRAAEFYQAAGTGYEPPTRPKGEHTLGQQAYRDLGQGRFLLPSGEIVSRAELHRRAKKPLPGQTGLGSYGAGVYR